MPNAAHTHALATLAALSLGAPPARAPTLAQIRAGLVLCPWAPAPALFAAVVAQRPRAEWFPLITQFGIATDETVLAAVVYLRRAEAGGLGVSGAAAETVFLAALAVAHKFVSDVPFDNVTFARLGGITLAEMNALELELLLALDFDVAIADGDVRAAAIACAV
eukprot:TRINITY_DN488_c0_g1_i1.p3 TRINITY_DN488_c0_g1~~TRINITY_DN488_c0_g1_i1.p3  ORF type:complete len:164 (-),score=50.02 TRINITY_DN488_c0_g1_i1:141-632(-)